MAYYINCMKSYAGIGRELKELVPDMNLRRRMGPGLKMGSATAMAVLEDFDAHGKVDAVVTATGLGCIADSEKFLAALSDLHEQALNPTPFIYSTFNTLGAIIALLRSEPGYNNTFSHRETSFECALLDAMMLIDEGEARNVLVGFFDEATPAVCRIVERLRLGQGKPVGEGAFFLVLTGRELACSQAEITRLSFAEQEIGGTPVSVQEAVSRNWFGAMAEALHGLVSKGQAGDYVLVNDLNGMFHSLMQVRCLPRE